MFLWRKNRKIEGKKIHSPIIMSQEQLKIIEYLGVALGILYVIGAILEKKWCWYAGLLATVMYAISVYHFQLYGEFILQFFYFGISFYGLMQWSKNQKKDDLHISHTTMAELGRNLLLGAVFSLGFYALLVYFEGSYPFWDSVTSGFGVSTTYLVARKKIENWILWVLIDIILCIVLYLKGMPFYSFLYIVYVFFALYGFFSWKKMFQAQKK